ncbi:MAG: hypothetical protein ACRDHZ_00650 [Ktedonobacteraceae bacterium]
MVNTARRPAEDFICGFGLFILSDRAMLPTEYKTGAGYHYSTEPIYEFDYHNRDALIAALKDALGRRNPFIETPSSKQLKTKTAMERRARANSWTDLQRKSIGFLIQCWKSDFIVEAWGRAGNGGWESENNPALSVSIPAQSGIEAVADAILDHLNKRNDLPGMVRSA